jgi:hypothetical protein
MFELVLLFIVVPVRSFMAARAVGRSGFAWALGGMAIFLCAEYAIIFGAAYGYDALAYLFDWEGFEETAGVYVGFLNLFAMCCGMAAAEVMRYKLMNPDEPYYDAPPPPEMFRTL